MFPTSSHTALSSVYDLEVREYVTKQTSTDGYYLQHGRLSLPSISFIGMGMLRDTYNRYV